MIAHSRYLTPDYIIVIDAGSSGTRVFAYTWQTSEHGIPSVRMIPASAAPHKIPRKTLPNRRAYHRVETEPGLAAYSNDIQGIPDKALFPLIDWASAVVPKWKRKSTPVFLFGTAGMRKLPIQEQDEILLAVRKALENSEFQFEPEWAQILTGTDEGMFGWIAVNFLGGTLRSASTKPTIGILDLGGSSLEVCFESSAPTPPSELVQVTLLGKTHQLYCHVHQSYGLDDAFDTSVSLLISEKKETDSNIVHPCLQEGYREEYSRLVKADGTIPQPERVILTGAPNFNYEACRSLARKVINEKQCDNPPCLIDSDQPDFHGSLHALTGFYVVYHFFKLDSAALETDVIAAGESFCKMPWDDVKKAYHGETQVEQYCFRSPYVTTLISQGLGLDLSKLKVDDGKVGWTLGAAIYEKSRLDTSQSKRKSASQLMIIKNFEAAAWIACILSILVALLLILLRYTNMTADEAMIVSLGENTGGVTGAAAATPGFLSRLLSNSPIQRKRRVASMGSMPLDARMSANNAAAEEGISSTAGGRAMSRSSARNRLGIV